MSKKQTPMMDQYFSIKDRYQEELLFFRLGDFYELFYDDALTASRELNITLTGRNSGEAEKAPMCGVPYHAAESYIEKLIKKGYKVAICEQVEDPKEAKGIVKRDVIRVITPGTVLTENGTEARENNFLALFYRTDEALIQIFCDVSTGEVIWDRISHGQRQSAIQDALSMYRPSEIVTVGSLPLGKELQDFIDVQLDNVALSPFMPNLPVADVREQGMIHFADAGLLEEDVLEGLGYLLTYLSTVIKTDISHINYIHPLHIGDRMVLDTSSLRHLEVTHNLRDGGVKGTLLQVLDKTLTPMGARLLKQWVESPLMDIHHIERRQRAITELIAKPTEQGRLRELLKLIFDFERILARVETGSVSPRDFTSLRESLRILPDLVHIAGAFESTLLQEVVSQIDCHADVYDLLNRAIAEQPALTLKDGRVIRDGFNQELDDLRSMATNSQEWLHRLEEEARSKTGIRLKTGYNKVFGYYFEVSHANAADVPDYFIRKQTLANAERYITPELKEFEVNILSAKDKIISLEQKLYQELREAVKEAVKPIQATARAFANLDVLSGLAQVAYEENYICPTMTMNGQITIRDGRHPVIEKYLKREVFVPNDVTLNHSGEEFLLITGPNMAGKSTYMRQVAVLMIMAQIGSFIPAREAVISPVDRIFTRVGASDDISTGQSTFMVEMKEVAYILNNATSNSLLILDEIGRGTSTFDGLSIAQAVVEHICKHIHGKTLFATHYHELICLEEQYEKLKNYTVAVKEKGKDVVFLRRIVRGGADRSYGIHVAKLAGLPNSVLKRAEVILAALEGSALEEAATPRGNAGAVREARMSTAGGSQEAMPLNGTGSPNALAAGSSGNGNGANDTTFAMPTNANLFTTSVLDDLLAVDVMSLTPIEALNVLYKLQEEARKGGGR
ncbi:MAG: DNA mismatch repair protein MutS [Veillonella sp.]|uniref:DNA mismatch repair protein MutS n=1 Tax=Veillonella sp. TaxID=1926307 RepID=UPI0025CEBF80|nr:DNA mismatch repair protein MutS [Veillonella sp.]MBE6080068.1 DNA mismatch repair protein MutS [Veillonella sp.]